MGKIKIICTEEQKKDIKNLIRIGLLSSISIEISHKMDLTNLCLGSFEFIITKEAGAKE